jgi:choloylglycine hydrolase
MKIIKKITLITLASATLLSSVQACTGTTIKAKDNSVVFGRTLEFEADLKSNVLVIPRGYTIQATAPNKSAGLKWQTKYAAVGTNGLGQTMLVDGLNEKGLAVGSFYFPQLAKFQDVSPDEYSKSISSFDVGAYLLTNFATIDEVKAGLNTVKVSDAKFPVWNFTLPLHYIITEPGGKSLVIEYIDGQLKTYDNPIGVLTNAPAFDWQLINLQNYVNLNSKDVEEHTFNENLTVKKSGLGSGMLGLPGDFTPPSRFVRSAFFTTQVMPVENNQAAILQVFHILNNFDIPNGSVQDIINGKVYQDITQWTSANDLKNKRFFIRTYHDSTIRMIDLKQFDLNAKTIKVISLEGETPFLDVSKQAKDLSNNQ